MEGQRHATSGEGQTTGNAGTKSEIDGKRQDGWCLEYQFTSLVFRQPGLTTWPLERTWTFPDPGLSTDWASA